MRRAWPKRRAWTGGFVGLSLAVAAALVPLRGDAAGMREGVEAYKRGDFAGALREWLPLAEQGNPNALYNVAQLYRTGKGVPKDIPLAEKFYREAAERGHVAAQGNLGTLYYFAFPDSPRVKPAFEWWEKAAKNGDGRSQYMLGVMLYNGTQVTRDPVRAYAWMRLASESGVPEAAKAEQQMVQTLPVKDISDGYALAQKLAPQKKLDPTPPASGDNVRLADVVKPSERPMEMAEEKPKPEPKPEPKVEKVKTEPKPEPKSEKAKAEPKAVVKARPEPKPEPKVEPKPEPKAEPGPKAEPAIAGGSGTFYVQVSASGSEAEANALKAKLEKKGGLNGGAIRVSPTVKDSGATVYRVQAGPYPTRKAANSQCAAFKKRKQSCFVTNG